MARLHLAVALLLAALATASANAPLTFLDLDPYRFQWNVTFGLTTTKDKTIFTPHNCTEKNLGKSCNQPAMNPDKNDKIQINITLKNETSVKNFQTHKAGTPTKVVVKLCYSETSSMDRPWRKANKVIAKNKACPITVKSFDWMPGTYNNHTVVYDFHTNHDLVKAVWYVRVLVKCKGATPEGVFCQYDGTKGKNYFETTTIEQIPIHMKTVMIIMSLVGPTFFISFFVVDTIRRKTK
jgi:hypothetical protein